MASRDRLEAVHRELLERYRQVMNLVGPGPIDPHYQDAHAALEGLEPSGHWADLGTGAGFPGAVLAARFPQITVDLVDSRRKRCVFLEEVLATAGVDDGVQVRCMRLEGLEPGRYDGITSRALAAPEAMLDIGRRLLKPGGTLVLFLQDDARPPVAEDYEVVSERTYAAGDKGRRVAVLRRTAG